MSAPSDESGDPTRAVLHDGERALDDAEALAFFPALQLRPEGRVIGNCQANPLLLAYVWMLPLGPVSLPAAICPEALGKVADAIGRGLAVGLQADDEAVVNDVYGMIGAIVGSRPR